MFVSSEDLPAPSSPINTSTSFRHLLRLAKSCRPPGKQAHMQQLRPHPSAGILAKQDRVAAGPGRRRSTGKTSQAVGRWRSLSHDWGAPGRVPMETQNKRPVVRLARPNPLPRSLGRLAVLILWATMGSWRRLGRCLAGVDTGGILRAWERCGARRSSAGLDRSTGSPELNAVERIWMKHWNPWRLSVGFLSAAVMGSWNYSQAEEVQRPFPSLGPDEGSTQVELVEGSLQTPPEGEVISNSHTARWRIYTNMGRELFSQGRLDEAERYFTRALEEAKKGFGEDDPHVASSYNNLAELLRLKREYTQAEPLYLEAVKRLERALGAEAQSVGFALHNLGSFYFIQRRFEEAESCYRRALKIKGRTMGFDHPECASTMFHLGEVLRVRGHVKDAEAYIRDSIRILEEAGGGHSKNAALRMGRLAEILVHTGQLQEAESFQRKLVHTLELLEGSEAMVVATAVDNLALTLQAENKLEEAEELLQRCLQIREQALGPDDALVGSTLFKLASVEMKLGETLLASGHEKSKEAGSLAFQNAEQHLQRAIGIAEKGWKEISEAATTTAPRVTKGVNRKESISSIMGETLLALTRSLNTLALLEMRKAELSSTPAEAAQSREKALQALDQLLSLLDQCAISTRLSDWPDVQKEQETCVHRRAALWNTGSKIRR